MRFLNRFIPVLLSLVVVASCGKINARLDSLEQRVLTLEQRCEYLNTNIQALVTAVKALEEADFITSVTPVAEGGQVVGYKLTFKHNSPIVIYNGEDGKDAPEINCRKEGNDYWWTIGGEWLLDENGQRIRAQGKDGVTPQIKVEDGKWWISYDGGSSWKEMGQDGAAVFRSVTEDAAYVYLTLVSGTVIALPKAGAGGIAFEDSAVKRICVINWDTDKDGELSFEEAAAVKDIGTEFRGKDILSFNEFAYFTGVTEVPDEAFRYSCLKRIKLPSSIRSIGKRAFASTEIESIEFPAGVEKISEAAFYAARKLRSASIPSSFTIVPRQIFAGCWSLEHINIPSGVTVIRDEAFHECFVMDDVELPEKLDSIGHLTFARCQAFTKMRVPETVSQIGSSAFYECTGLKELVLPSKLATLDAMVVYGCKSLESFTVPENVTQIGWFTFWNCENLHTIYLNPVKPPVVRTDNTGAENLFTGCPSDLKLVTPNPDAYKRDAYWSRYSGKF